MHEGMWIRYPVEPDSGAPRSHPGMATGDGRFVRYLIPMAYTADGRSIITLDDYFTVAVYDAATGTLVGRERPPFEDHEGQPRIAADGSRTSRHSATRRCHR